MRTRSRRTLFVAALATSAACALAVALQTRDAPPLAAGEPEPARPLPDAVDPWAKPARFAPADILYDRFETLGVADGLPSERVTCVLAEGDDLYVGTDSGLAIRRDGAWTVVGPEDGLSHRYVTSVARDTATDTTWVSTLRGVSRVSGGDVRVFTQKDSGLVNDVVYHCVVDGPLVWCGTGAGLSVLDTRSGSWTIYDTNNSIMHEPWCYAVALGPQRGWVGLWGGAIVEVDRRTGRWREYRDPDGEMEIDLLPDDGPIHEVTSFLAYGEGLLWQATYFGLSRYDGRRWSSFTKADAGLPGDFISHVAAIGDASWIGSDEGLGVLRGGTVVSYVRNEDGTCTRTVTENGAARETTSLATAPGDNYILWAFPREHDVWLATGHGLTRGLAATAPPGTTEDD